jgi:hypothetical protein
MFLARTADVPLRGGLESGERQARHGVKPLKPGGPGDRH